MEQKDKKTETIEKVEKVANVIDKSVMKADEILGSAKTKSGAVGSKVHIGIIVLAVLAMVRDSAMIWIALGVFALLFLKAITATVKKQMGSSQKKTETTEVKTEEEKK